MNYFIGIFIKVFLFLLLLFMVGCSKDMQTVYNERYVDYISQLQEKPPVDLDNDAEKYFNILNNTLPIVLIHEKEPSGILFYTAIIHPHKNIVAYHIGFDFDIDYPSESPYEKWPDEFDNEVFWVEYNDNYESTTLTTLFHGYKAVITLSRRDRPMVGIEWGKHGILPLNGRVVIKPYAVYLKLRWSWFRLSTYGIKNKNNPQIKHMLKKYQGNWKSYNNFTYILPNSLLTLMVCEYENACLFYARNSVYFKPRIEWAGK